MKKAIPLFFALLLIISLALPVMATDAVQATVNNNTGHAYNAYQIFDGTQSDTEASLGSIDWGTGIDSAKKGALISAIKAIKLANGSAPFSTCESAADVADVLSGKAYNAEEALLFAKTVSSYLSSTSVSISADATSITVDPGYYLLVDNYEANGQADVTGLSMLQITGHEFTITSKTTRPSVDKRVQDEAKDKDAKSSDTEGWGETADHAINESFQFELLGEIPRGTNLALYDTYKIVFEDTMSAGITFEKIESVTINGSVVSVKSDSNANGYSLSTNAVKGAEGITWTLAIDDIKPYLAGNLDQRVVVEVIYSAHLNESAVIGNTDDNENTVTLQYSNNPNVDGEGDLGKTPSDTVWVFTYKIDSTKYKNSIEDSNVLPGAGFTLYTAAEYDELNDNDEATTAEPVKLTQKNGVYYPDAAGETTEMTSGTNGQFNVHGLDVGIYYLVETTVPDGYNKCSDVRVEISAMHNEVDTTTAKTEITMKQDDITASDLRVDIINNAGATLPETGGIGTTIFYVVGAALVLGAVVLLITKKRMTADE